MLFKFLLAAIKEGATEELRQLLEKFREKHGTERHDQLVIAISNSFTLLQEVTDETKTKIDDTLVAIILNALPDE